jgi:hypothetical protein
VISFAVFGFLPSAGGIRSGESDTFCRVIGMGFGLFGLIKASQCGDGNCDRLHPGQALFSCAPFNAKANCLVSEATEEGCYLFCWYNSLRPFGESTVTVYWIGDISSKDAMNESTV